MFNLKADAESIWPLRCGRVRAVTIPISVGSGEVETDIQRRKKVHI